MKLVFWLDSNLFVNTELKTPALTKYLLDFNLFSLAIFRQTLFQRGVSSRINSTKLSFYRKTSKRGPELCLLIYKSISVRQNLKTLNGS